MKFIFTCGGTAGHINPAIAIAGRLRELMPDSEFLFLGAEGKMEMELVPREGYEIRPLKVTNLSRGHDFEAFRHNIDAVRNVTHSLHEAKHIIREFAPDAVIGTGGYVCFPVLTAAARLHIPTLVHESNAVPGLTTKLLAETVDKIMVGFEQSRNFYSHPDKVVVTGTPVRGEFACYTKDEAKKTLGIDPSEKLIVSVWGSLGAGHMNDIMSEFIGMMGEGAPFRIIHSVGTRYYKDFMEKLNAHCPDYAAKGADVREYIYDMPKVMAAADLIMCRAGASTLSELSYMGKPVIMVPSPNVTNNHQEKNARVLEKAGGAKVFLEGEFDARSLYDEAVSLLADGEKLKEMSKAMKSLSVDDSTEQICSLILELTEKKEKR